MLVGIVCFSIAAIFVFSGGVYTRLGYEIKRSVHPVLFWLLIFLFLLAGFRCLFLV